jgi:hypothetical protein
MVEKTAEATFTREYAWTLDKYATPAALAGFIGESMEAEYEVSVNRSFVDYGFAVAGEIEIFNPVWMAVGFGVTDVLEGGIAAVVDCPKTTVSASETVTCAYSAAVPDDTTRLNTATVTTDAPEVRGGTAEALAVFGAVPGAIAGFPEVIVTDTQSTATDPWPASGTVSWIYPASFDCPTDPALYVGDGVYSYTTDNTALVVETGQTATEQVTVTCYAPIVSTDSYPVYNRQFLWDITKETVPTSHVGFPGDAFESEVVVAVDQTTVDSGFEVFGTITVTNPNPNEAMTVAIADSVGDLPATLDCEGTLVVPASGQATCSYMANLLARVDGTNTVSVAFGGATFEATAPWAFGEPRSVDGLPQIEVLDTIGNKWSASSDAMWTYVLPFACPTEYTFYAETGEHAVTIRNTAVITQSGEYAEALIDLTCYYPAAAKIIKTVQEGAEAIGQVPFTFELYAPDATLVETVALDAAGEAVFTTALDMTGTWTVAEVVPLGWVGTEPTSCTFEVVYPAAAAAAFTCAFENVEKGGVAVIKLVNGYPAESEWAFALYADSLGFGTEPTDTMTVPYGQFTADLDPFEAYTLCELDLPAGWYAEWMIDTDADRTADTTVTPYNPNIGEDLGNRCFELGLGTAYAVPIGDTLVLTVDNKSEIGEGAPRAPGYWKNWSTCTSGNKAATAGRNGGPEEGFWLIDDVLPVTWDDMLIDGFVFTIDTCEVAVGILSMQDLQSGTARAGDPAYKLAGNLLAFQANVTAGACSPEETVFDGAEWQAIEAEAEQLLDAYDFDGIGTYFRVWGSAPGKKVDPNTADALRAQELAATLDLYNNGMFCGGAEQSSTADVGTGP